MDRKPTMSASASRIKNAAPRQSIAYTRASVIGLPSQMPTHAATTASLRAPPAGASATAVATAAPRTLTEELEKIEQSITLTLQEIDQNFSTSHRIITSSILPIVEEYALQSQAVWQSSKFWKEFFESSANVSLAGYEELNAEEETVNDVDQSQATEYSATMDYDYSHAGMQTPREAAKSAQESQQADASIGVTDDMDDSSFVTYVNNKYSNVKSKREESRQQAFPMSKYEDVEDDIETERSIAGTAQFMKSLNLDDQSTPRVVLRDRSDILNGIDERQTTRSQPHTMQWADMVSPFEEMRSELKARHIGSFESSTSISLPQGLQNIYDRDDQSLEPPLPTTQIQSSSFTEPRTPGRQHLYRRPENSTIDEESASILRTPESSPFSPFVGANRPRSYGGQQSVLLHRVLDKKWGIQVTPKGPSPSKRAQLARHGRQASAMATPKNAPISYASRFSSSPLDSPPVPHINSTIFSSPERS